MSLTSLFSSIRSSVHAESKGRSLEIFFWLCDGKKIGADSTTFYDFIGNAIVAKFEMAGWFIEGGIDNRILDHNLAQYSLPLFSLESTLNNTD